MYFQYLLVAYDPELGICYDFYSKTPPYLVSSQIRVVRHCYSVLLLSVSCAGVHAIPCNNYKQIQNHHCSGSLLQITLKFKVKHISWLLEQCNFLINLIQLKILTQLYQCCILNGFDFLWIHTKLILRVFIVGQSILKLICSIIPI